MLSEQVYGSSLFNFMLKEYPNCDCDIENNNYGTNDGVIVTMKDIDDDSIKGRYYVKPHVGVKTSRSLDNSKLDVKELFLYKVLEHMGYGPKTYFLVDTFIRLSDIVFIATEDAAWKTHDQGKEKSFNTMYEIDKKQLDVSNYNKVDLVVLNILIKLCNIADIYAIPNNYGLITVTKNNKTRYKWKIIDSLPGEDNRECKNTLMQKMSEEAENIMYKGTSRSSNTMEEEMPLKNNPNFEKEVCDVLLHGKQINKGGNKLSLDEALKQARQDVVNFFHQINADVKNPQINKRINVGRKDEPVFKEDWMEQAKIEIDSYIKEVNIAMKKAIGIFRDKQENLSYMEFVNKNSPQTQELY